MWFCLHTHILITCGVRVRICTSGVVTSPTRLIFDALMQSAPTTYWEIIGMGLSFSAQKERLFEDGEEGYIWPRRMIDACFKVTTEIPHMYSVRNPTRILPAPIAATAN